MDLTSETLARTSPENAASDATSRLEVALSQHMSSKFGRPGRCRLVKNIFPAKSRSRKIQYQIFNCTLTDAPLFVKSAKRLRTVTALEEFLSGKNWASFETPVFHGQVGYSDGVFAVWEKVPHIHMKNFGDGPLDTLSWLADIVAEVNGATDEIRQDRTITLLEKARWIEPSAEKLVEAIDALESADVDRDRLMAGAQAYALHEDRVLRRFGELERVYVTHNDFSPQNIMIEETGDKPVVVDWEMTSFAVAGAGLRNFAHLPNDLQSEIAAYYAAKLGSLGIVERAADVFFAMGAVQFYYHLSTGIVGRSQRWLEKALSEFNDLVAVRL